MLLISYTFTVLDVSSFRDSACFLVHIYVQEMAIHTSSLLVLNNLITASQCIHSGWAFPNVTLKYAIVSNHPPIVCVTVNQFTYFPYYKWDSHCIALGLNWFCLGQRCDAMEEWYSCSISSHNNYIFRCDLFYESDESAAQFQDEFNVE